MLNDWENKEANMGLWNKYRISQQLTCRLKTFLLRLTVQGVGKIKDRNVTV